jgi:hypothetical protein
LKKRLGELVEQKIILKHRYLDKIDSSKIKENIYGVLPRNPYSLFPPMIKRNYYMLSYQEFLSLGHKRLDRVLGKVSNSTLNEEDNTKNELKYRDYIERYYSKKRL